MSDTKIVWKPYLDYEREEAWLNLMAAEGWELKRYTWMRYRFERGVPGRYIYRLELLPDLAGSSKSRDYFAFLEDAGVEVVSRYGRWVYLRKASAEGPFEVFSDLDSKTAHERRVGVLFTSIAAALLPSVITVMIADDLRQRMPWLFPLVVAEAVLMVSLIAVAARHLAHARALERQRRLQE